jgi:hypothetical protein
MDDAGTGRPEPISVVALVLPTSDDLWGDGWRVEPDDNGDGPRLLVTPDRCLPPDFPDGAVVADAGRCFVRTAAMVHATSLVFDDFRHAGDAWQCLATTRFANCFAQSVADDAELPPGAHLLGPTSPPSGFDLARDQRRVAQHRAIWSRADDDGVTPVVLDLVVVQAGRAVVLVWAIDGDRGTADAGWPRLVDRLVLRGDAARALD